MVRRRLAALLVFLCLPAIAQAQVILQLKDSFIERYKHRVTIDANLTVDHSHKSPKTPSPSKPSNDGDIHVSARSPQIGLPIVAELMNAADARPQIKVFVNAAASGDKVRASGAWRLWCEHGGVVDQIQGRNWPKAEHTNPDHCFEIHPLTEVEGSDVRHTWKPIHGFKNKDAEAAFERYENLRAEIIHSSSKKTTTIQTTALGYNYVEFILELEEDPAFLVEDGLIVRASVYTFRWRAPDETSPDGLCQGDGAL